MPPSRPDCGNSIGTGTAPLILTAQFSPADQAWADTLRRDHFPPERNFVPAHITLFHHLPPGSLTELKRMLVTQVRSDAPPAQIDRLLSLGRGVALHVDCPGLVAIRAALSDRLHGLLVPQDQAQPRLHITVQNKVAPEVARATLGRLERAIRLPRPLAIASLNLWYYRGGPWEAAARYPFRG